LLFSKKTLEATKRMTISFPVEKEHFPTFHFPRYNSFLLKGISMCENPHRSEVVAKVISKKADKN
jgi:hypothetical protein